MNTNKTFKTVKKNGKQFNLLALPKNNFFKFEIINLYGSNIERVIEKKTGKNLYGISHFIEHLSFKSTKDFTSDELMNIGKNEGVFNASTNHDRINYWFKTTMDNMDLAIKFVCNVSQNDLIKVEQKEYDTEKDVVYNEAKRAMDDHQQMFYRNAQSKLLNNHKEDTVIGTPQTIDGFTLADAIAIKNIFLSHDQYIYNITYDSALMSEDEIIEKIEKELLRFEVTSVSSFDINDEDYKRGLKFPKNVELKVESELKQAMTSLTIDAIDNNIVTDASLNYLARLAPESSLTEMIREKNGLTYGLYFYTNVFSYKPYISFASDVTVGNETKLMELFKESINLSADNFDREKYNKYMKTVKLKRTMSNLNLTAHNIWFTYSYRASNELDELRDILTHDIEDGYSYLDNQVTTYENMNGMIQKIKEMVNDGAFAKVATH